MNLFSLSRNIILFKRNLNTVSVKSTSQVLCKLYHGCLMHSVKQEIEECAEEFTESTSNKIRGVPISADDYKERKCLRPNHPENPHLLKVAIFGEPNAGKSTLTNSLVKWKVCAVSKKVHTTRQKSSAVFVEDNKQIVFIDTPGFVTPQQGKKHKLEVSLVVDPEISVRSADLVAVIVDVSNKFTSRRLHPELLRLLDNFKEKKSILILNKVDALKKKKDLLDITRVLTRGVVDGAVSAHRMKKCEKNLSLKETQWRMFERTEKLLAKHSDGSPEIPAITLEHGEGSKGWPQFSKVFMISALHEEGVDDLREYLLSSTIPSYWMYHDSIVTNKHPYDIALTIVREKLLENIPDEIPYAVKLKIKSWTVDLTGCLRIHITIGCPKPHYKKIIIGNSGKRIHKCVEDSRQSLQDTFRSEILLKLGVESF